MQVLLEADDVLGFLSAYGQYLQARQFEPAAALLTQRLLPTVLRRSFDENRLTAHEVVALWRYVHGGELLLVENDLRSHLNQRIDGALESLGLAEYPTEPLAMLGDQPKKEQGRVRRASTAIAESAMQFKRVAIISSFTIRTWSATDAFDFRKNVCASSQEREFLWAVRQYFPSMLAYPNVPVRNFIDVAKMNANLSVRTRTYAWNAEVDVLLCTLDEDPIAAIELDSVHHDKEDVVERDELKNRLFKLAGVHLVRIRASDSRAVRAEDFFDLLVAEGAALDQIRPRRLRPRRTHDGLAPAGSRARASRHGVTDTTS